jgi:hypothetical protein
MVLQDGYSATTLELHWCCRDDFGLGIKEVCGWYSLLCSSWDTAQMEMIPFLLARRQCTFITFKKYTHSKTLPTHCIWYKIENNKVIAATYDAQNQTSLEIIADKVIMATQFVNQYFF